jgi:hypothetical protein
MMNVVIVWRNCFIKCVSEVDDLIRETQLSCKTVGKLIIKKYFSYLYDILQQQKIIQINQVAETIVGIFQEYKYVSKANLVEFQSKLDKIKTYREKYNNTQKKEIDNKFLNLRLKIQQDTKQLYKEFNIGKKST